MAVSSPITTLWPPRSRSKFAWAGGRSRLAGLNFVEAMV